MSARRMERAGRIVTLISGLVLFLFAAMELCSDAVGLVSLQTMGDIAAWQLSFTRSWPGLVILCSACVCHVLSTLWFTARRATLRMSFGDAALIASGILVPLLLLPYLVDTRLANIKFGVDDDILYRLAKLWPDHNLAFVSLIVLVWGHGCIGIHRWLRLSPGYRSVAPGLAVIALAIPIAALAGVIAAARIVAVLMAENSFAEQVRAATHWPSADAEQSLSGYRLMALGCYGALLVLAAGALVIRFLRILVAPKIDVTYVKGPKLKASTGATLLEISLLNGVPHANTCGGRGRCTACSVRIEQGEGALPPRTAAELAQLGGDDQRIRLACQITPTAALTVTRLTATDDAGDASDVEAAPELDTAGIERQVVAFSVRLQGHAALVNSRPAYDAIFFLNEFLDMVHAAIVKNNGAIMRTTESGMIAVFGQDDLPQAASSQSGSVQTAKAATTSTKDACRAAFAAAADIDVALDRLNERFSAEFGQPIAVAMGLTLGTAYLGRIGAGASKPFTAVGPAIDGAEGFSRLAESRKYQLAAVPAAIYAGGIDAGAMEAASFSAPNGEKHDVFMTSRARLGATAGSPA
ncbi:2Fe-2S iron-sulfur cluster-binding protein [Bradyrhizobium commune]|uniref:2Fe-2S iron-sulfur cluster binding domain-containing protein n=1 Tax=Bradyrhizobium commune TaxID=83627 RepID=A0A7S9D2X4_9BRAD|nr:2Fe-2S iron-sulfur cluster-binding protein [Bradyrhizobium commune]QPF90218.1 2Fe-2S iron-sulfur cluster binding domain-containing protein [Bradyrhizobium commune]